MTLGKGRQLNGANPLNLSQGTRTVVQQSDGFSSPVLKLVLRLPTTGLPAVRFPERDGCPWRASTVRRRGRAARAASRISPGRKSASTASSLPQRCSGLAWTFRRLIPSRALFCSAVVNGFVAVPLTVADEVGRRRAGWAGLRYAAHARAGLGNDGRHGSRRAGDADRLNELGWTSCRSKTS